MLCKECSKTTIFYDKLYGVQIGLFGNPTCNTTSQSRPSSYHNFALQAARLKQLYTSHHCAVTHHPVLLTKLSSTFCTYTTLHKILRHAKAISYNYLILTQHLAVTKNAVALKKKTPQLCTIFCWITQIHTTQLCPVTQHAVEHMIVHNLA